MTLVRFDSVSKSFAGRSVLQGLSFIVERGDIYGLLGPNGCGKSTAINILCGLLDPDAGTVTIEIAGGREGAIGVCPQEIALYRDLYPQENLDFFARLHGMSEAERRRRVAELVELFGLGPFSRTRVSDLSGGWQRRVNIAVALVRHPDLLILDEPTAAVDIEARHELWQMIELLETGGVSILMTTHQLDEAERLCTRIGIMKDGRICAEGTVAELLSRVPAELVAFVQGPDESALLARAAQLGWAVRRYAGRIACLLQRRLDLRQIAEAFAGVEISAVSCERVALEHAYLEVLQGATSADA